MDTIKFIEQSLNESYERLTKSLQGLKPEELLWHPKLRANCIAEIAMHVARAEDRMRARAGLGPELWISQNWYQRFGYPQQLSRDMDYKLLKVLNLDPPKLEDLLTYLEALHRDTVDKLHSLSPEALDRVPDVKQPNQPISALFRHLIVHTNNHHGQIDYIRGLLEPDWDLPPGTGIIQS